MNDSKHTIQDNHDNKELCGPKASFDPIFRKLLLLLPAGLLVTLCFVTYSNGEQLATLFRAFSPGYLALVLLLGIIPWFTHSLRMLIWTRFLGDPLRFKDLLSITLGCELGAAVSPTAVGGGPVKFGMLLQKGYKPGRALYMTTVGSLEDGVFFVLSVPLALTLSSTWHLLNAKTGAGVLLNWISSLKTILPFLLAAAVLLCLLLVLLPKLKASAATVLAKLTSKIRVSVTEAAEVYHTIIKKGKLQFLAALLLTAIQWSCRYSIMFVLLKSLDVSFEPLLFFALQWIVAALGIFIPTPGAAGGAELAFYVIFSSFIPENLLTVAVAGWRLATFYLVHLAGAVVFMSLLASDTKTRRIKSPAPSIGKLGLPYPNQIQP